MEHDEMVQKFATLEGSMKTAFKRLDGHDSDIKEIKSDNKILHEMNKNIAVLAANNEYQGKKIDCIEVDIKELKEKPAKRYDTIVTLIITLIVSGVVGFILGKVFGG